MRYRILLIALLIGAIVGATFATRVDARDNARERSIVAYDARWFARSERPYCPSEDSCALAYDDDRWYVYASRNARDRIRARNVDASRVYDANDVGDNARLPIAIVDYVPTSSSCPAIRDDARDVGWRRVPTRLIGVRVANDAPIGKRRWRVARCDVWQPGNTTTLYDVSTGWFARS
jgi:hypothetical protein